jgi:hypothetical protein
MLTVFQIHRIVDKLIDEETAIVRPRDLDEPWCTIYDRVHPLRDLTLAERELWKATEGLPDRNRLVEAVLAELPDAEAMHRFPSLAELANILPPVDWLWPGWIPRGMLSLLGAAPGSGKSMVALDLARRIIHGEPWPDGVPMSCPGANVLFVDAEGVPHLQNQRASHWEMDTSRLYLMLPPDSYGQLDLADAKQQDILLDMIHDLQPGLLIVDSLSSISVRGENAVEDVRALLHFLSALAFEFNLPLLLIHHLRKRLRIPRTGPRPHFEQITAEELRGSSHIIAMARSVIALSVYQAGSRPARSDPRRLEVVKSNLASFPPPLALRLEAQDGSRTPVLRYTAWRDSDHGLPQVKTCSAWLLDHLAEADGPLAPKDIIEAAAEAGFSRSAVYRAHKRLGPHIVEAGGVGPASPRTWALSPETDRGSAGQE